MRLSTVIAGLLFGLEAAAIRVGTVQPGKIEAEVRARGFGSRVVQKAQSPSSLTVLVAYLLSL